MLDDLKYMHEKDQADALGIVSKQGDQLRQTYTFDHPVSGESVANVVLAGMGGSALAALLLRTWPGLSKPFEIVRDYDVPPYVGGDTLFIASSYSGNTEETLSALAAAEARGAVIAVIASGGKLAELAQTKQYPLALLPYVDQPRYAVLYNFAALLQILEQAGLLPAGKTGPELVRAAAYLDGAVAAWQPTVPTTKNPAKQLALECIGKSVVIYGGPKMYPAAYKWKISFNENAKQVAWVNQLPEFNHNEFIGWSKQPVDKPYTVIELRSPLEHERVQKRFAVTERLLSGLRPAPLVVTAEGNTLLEQLLWTSAFGDFVSIYTALCNGINPAPVDLVERFKKELEK
ncbi:MAG TPA: bifunctional phosphoglucose/phosphomannose isomerase [Candidatus Saccharimonadales bacterium]|nr:bifunctional phosphoglucose/phosphomannose isomerase [Candidatus Saccharimonadales bacterium]